MYALLARRPVFRGKSLPDMLHMQRFEQPDPLRKHAPDAPEELERILAQLLEKDPNRRVPNANILGRRLEAMLHALSASPPTAAADRDWFLRDEPSAAEEVRRDSLPSDVVPPPEPDRPNDSLPTTQVLPPPAAQANQPPAKAIPLGQKPADAAGPPPTRGHFVLVAEEELDQVPAEEPRPTLFSLRTSWQTWVLAGALLCVGLTIRWFLQPPTADVLYRRIDARATDPSPNALPEAEDDIQEFLSRYPSDPRAGQLRGYEKEIDLYRLEKRFQQRVKELAGTGRLTAHRTRVSRGAQLSPSRHRTWHGQVAGARRSLQRVGGCDRADGTMFDTRSAPACEAPGGNGKTRGRAAKTAPRAARRGRCDPLGRSRAGPGDVPCSGGTLRRQALGRRYRPPGRAKRWRKDRRRSRSNAPHNTGQIARPRHAG